MSFQCEAMSVYQLRKEQQTRCEHKARVEIDGKKLCLKHAGRVAIRLELLSGVAKKLPVEVEDI